MRRWLNKSRDRLQNNAGDIRRGESEDSHFFSSSLLSFPWQTSCCDCSSLAVSLCTQPSFITLSNLMWKREEKKKPSKAKLKTVALCACESASRSDHKVTRGFVFFGVSGGGVCVRRIGGSGAVVVGEEGVALAAEEQVIAGTRTAKKKKKKPSGVSL